jgi:iron complex outermembrane receptor protein
LKAVANFGYDQLSGRSYGNTAANYLNGIKGSGYNNTYENIESRDNKVWFVFKLQQESRCNRYTIDVTGGYTYQDFRDSKNKSNYNFENNSNGRVIYSYSL